MSVIGIDPSFTGTGIIILNDIGTRLDELLIKTPAKDNIVDRVKAIVKAINNIKSLVTLDIVSIEGFSYGSPQYAHQMGYLGFRIREYFMQNWKGVPIIEPSPNQVKKFATGKGVAEKDLIIKEVYKRWGYDTNNNNTADAYVLAQIGRAYLEVTEGLTSFQQEVIASLKGEKSAKKPRKKKVDA